MHQRLEAEDLFSLEGTGAVLVEDVRMACSYAYACAMVPFSSIGEQAFAQAKGQDGARTKKNSSAI